MMKEMDKKISWILAGIIIAILIIAIFFMINIGGNSRIENDSSLFPFASFFVIFILPGIITQRKKKREHLINENNLESDF